MKSELLFKKTFITKHKKEKNWQHINKTQCPKKRYTTMRPTYDVLISSLEENLQFYEVEWLILGAY